MTARTTKGLRIATRCTSIDQFVAAFHRFCDAQTCFIATLTMRPVGLETAFSIDLADGQPALRGLGVVNEAWPTPGNRFGRPGLLLGIKKLTVDSVKVVERLRAATSEATPPAPAPPPPMPAVVVATKPKSIAIAIPVLPKPEAKPDLKPEPAKPAPPPSPPKLSPIALAKPASSTHVGPPPALPKLPPQTPPPAPPEPPPVPVPVRPVVEAKPAPEPPPRAPEPPPPPPVDAKPLSAPLPMPAIVADGTRTPGSELVLPANPLMNISDDSLEGFVDCTIYEETGNFFPVDEDETSASGEIDAPAEPPVRAPSRMTAPPLAAVTVEPPLAMPTPFPAPLPALPTPMPMYIGISTPPPGVIHLQLPQHMDEPPMTPAPMMPPPMMPAPMMPVAPVMHPSFAHPQRSAKRRIALVAAVAVATLGVVMAVAAAHDDGSSSGAPARTNAGSAAPAAPAPQVVEANTPPLHRAPSPPSPRPAVVADVAPPHAAAAAPDADDTDPPDPPSTGAPAFGAGPCKIAVSTTPAGSIVSIDGDVAGPSPITINGPCTRRKVDIAHPRYAPATRLVTATPETAAVDVALARPTHDLYVETSPPGAVVSIDGHRAGTSPTLVKVMGFTSITLRIEKFGWKPVSQKIYSKKPNDRVAIKLGH